VRLADCLRRPGNQRTKGNVTCGEALWQHIIIDKARLHLTITLLTLPEDITLDTLKQRTALPFIIFPQNEQIFPVNIFPFNGTGTHQRLFLPMEEVKHITKRSRNMHLRSAWGLSIKVLEFGMEK